MGSFKENQYNNPPQTAFNKQAFKDKKKKTKYHLNKTVRGYTGNKEPGKKYPLYKSNMLVVSEAITIPKGPVAITIWEAETDFHGNKYSDGIPRVDVSITPLTVDDYKALEKSGYILDKENNKFIKTEKKFGNERQEGYANNSNSRIGGGNFDTGQGSSGVSISSQRSTPETPPSTTNFNEFIEDEDYDDDIPF